MIRLQPARLALVSSAALLCCVLFSSDCLSQQYSAGLLGGYSGGTGFQLQGTASHLSPTFPASLRLGVERMSLDPGDPDAARAIFINNATNGTPEERGHVWAFRFDVLYPLSHPRSPQRLQLFGGPRFARFSGNFKYVGGNEDFDVRGNHWGWGGGLELGFPVSPRTELTVIGGLDYFLGATLTGHDTSYSPDGTTVNQREDYTYRDADDAVNQPAFEPRILAGVNYRFGR